ncbi:TIR domain-containing protein [Paractinoplanes globisporus]|uniref:TIR domain-containing protein n=1 Tax=Paractinoplanes globisporus TaxID=113565 RepID=A0ABW6W7C9_9ACTN|nr:TIR domain-containing protein [Actinoplanes globisporus]
MTFDGFISYSHAADGRLAPAVQRGLHRLAKPWHRRRALWIFRDQTGLAVTPGLWSSIQTALDGSEYFVLLASPEAAASPWVNKEIEHWIATKSADRVLPVVTDGEWTWDGELGDFTAESTAVPPTLRGVFSEEPFFLDLRWARGSEQLSLHHARFRDAIAQLAAPMHGVSKDELEGEDVRQHRRVKRLRSGAVATLVVLALLASLTGLSAVRNADRAKAAAAEALRQQEVANSQRDSAQRSAEEARRQQVLAQQQQDLAQQQKARAAQAAIEADKSEQAAKEQQKLADQAAAEARRQRRLADQASVRTRKQQQLAKEAADRAQRMQAEAQRLATIAAQQRRLADQAAEEARKQQAKADQQERIAVSRRLMNQATASAVDDPKTALMLGTAAQNLDPGATSRLQLTGVVAATHYTGAIGDVQNAKFLPDGRLLALGTDGRYTVWNVADPRNPVRGATLPFTAATADPLEISSDGLTAAAGNGAEIDLWDITDLSRPARLGTVPSTRIVTAIAFTRDKSILLMGDGRGASSVWDTSDLMHPTRLATLTGEDWHGVAQIALAPDGSRAILDKDRFVPFFDLSEPSIPMGLPALIGWGQAPMVFSPDSTTVAFGENTLTVGGSSAKVGLYDATGENPADMPTADPWPTPSVSWTYDPNGPPPPLPDNPDTVPFDQLSGNTGRITSVAYSPDGSLVAAGDSNGTTMVWNVGSAMSPGPLASVKTHGAINSVSFDRTGLLATTDSFGVATLWKIPGPSAPDPLAMVTAPAAPLTTVFGPDGRSLVAAGADGRARTWNIADPSHPTRGADATLGAGVHVVRYSPDSRTVATIAGNDWTLSLADVTQPARATTLTAAGKAVRGTWAMEFSPDGRTLAVLATDATTTLTLWDVADRGRPTLLGTHTGGDFATSMTFSPDGRTLATAGYNQPTITMWNVANRANPVPLATVQGMGSGGRTMAFSPDGHTLASGGYEQTALLWDITDPVHPYRLATLAGHTAQVKTLAFSPDGRTLATGADDYSVILWDTTLPAVPVRLAKMNTPSAAEPVGLVFGRDGRTLAVTGQPNQTASSNVTLWSYANLNTLRADPAKYACSITGRGLTAAEWARFIPELPYRRTCAT